MAQADGKITIVTKIDNDEAAAELQELQQLIDQAGGDIDEKMVQKAAELSAKYNELIAKQEQLNAKIEEQASIRAGILAEIAQAQAIGGPSGSAETERLNLQLAKAETKMSTMVSQSDALTVRMQKVQLDARLLAENINRAGKGAKSAGKSAEDMNKAFSQGLKKVAKIALALFSLRSIYSLLSRAARTWLNSDNAQAKQLRANIEYMMYAIGSALQPIIQTLVNWLATALGYINAMSKALFNFDMFANASKESMKSTAQSAKEIKNSLAGFDEMNVLGGGASGAGAGSAPPPIADIDLDVKTKEAEESLQRIFGWFFELNPVIQNTVIILGILAIALLAVGVALSLVSLPILIIIAGIALLIIIILAVAKNWDFLKAKVIQFTQAVIDKISGLGRWFSEIWGKIGMSINKAFIDAWNGVKNFGAWVRSLFDNVFAAVRNGWNKIVDLFSKGGKIFTGLVDGISNIFKNIVNGMIDGLNKIISEPLKFLNGMLNKIRETSVLGFQPFIKLWGYNPLPIPKIPKLAAGGIVVRPTQAIIGEAGKEAVLPLENNTEWMQQLADMINSQSGENVVNVYLDGRMIERQVSSRKAQRDFAFNK
ncbi:MAG: hypothetical protein CVU96_01005 [Firmicutes bacterium HGW-Firmicutes-20]|jgi:hypothetical protein|nr:MAG: hypothetical protein CVU96_01005 [Firmicutes bacterium HGW-Firmicutes-20]PKM65986.1 MAG: hypothetical protein CVU94_07915 [Firmicutes bacterium HGW-Firmicutes-19]